MDYFGAAGHQGPWLCMMVLLTYPSTLANAGWKGCRMNEIVPRFDTVALSVPNHRPVGTGMRTHGITGLHRLIFF